MSVQSNLEQRANRSDLEHRIRETYSTINEYTQELRSSSVPREQARARRVIDEQRKFLTDDLERYSRLSQSMGLLIPQDILQIAAIMGINMAWDIRSLSAEPEDDLPQIQRILETFSDSELRLLMFDLGMDLDYLTHDNLDEKVVELVDTLKRRSRKQELIKYLQLKRPHMLSSQQTQ